MYDTRIRLKSKSNTADDNLIRYYELEYPQEVKKAKESLKQKGIVSLDVDELLEKEPILEILIENVMPQYSYRATNDPKGIKALNSYLLIMKRKD